MTTQFEQDIQDVINRHSVENQSDTPDYILAMYLRECLEAFAGAVRARDRWYGFDPWAKLRQPLPAPGPRGCATLERQATAGELARDAALRAAVDAPLPAPLLASDYFDEQGGTSGQEGASELRRQEGGAI